MTNLILATALLMQIILPDSQVFHLFGATISMVIYFGWVNWFTKKPSEHTFQELQGADCICADVSSATVPDLASFCLGTQFLLYYFVNRNGSADFIYTIKIVQNDALRKVVAENSVLGYYFFEETIVFMAIEMFRLMLEQKNEEQGLGFSHEVIANFAQLLQQRAETVYFEISEDCMWPFPDAVA